MKKVSLQKQAMELTKQWIEKTYGKRCNVFSYYCPSCEAWSAYDRLFADMEIEYAWMKPVKQKHIVGKRFDV